MSNYGIKNIYHDNWKEDHELRFSIEAYENWHEDLKPGSRILIFDNVVQDAIVGEVEVTDEFDKIDEEQSKTISESNETLVSGAVPTSTPTATVSDETKTATSKNANTEPDVSYILPVKTIRKGDPIPQTQVRDMLDVVTFPFAEEWTLLSEDDYKKITSRWN